MKKIVRHLTFWVLLAILLGILVGHFFPNIALHKVIQKDWKFEFDGIELLVGSTFSGFLSGVFISLVKIFIVPIIFLTISLGIGNMSSLKKVGRVGGKALLYFEIVTTIALLIGVLVAWLIQPGANVDTDAVAGGDISRYKNAAHTFSWLSFLADNLMIQVLLFSIIFGIVLSKSAKRDRIIVALTRFSKYVFKGLHWIMYLAPFGAFGGMAYTISVFGLQTLLPLGKLMLTVYITMALFIFVVLGLILRYYKVSILAFLKYIRQELLIVLGTSSSEPALPSLMEKLEQMGCSKPVVGLVVPAGYSFNLDGTSIYLSMSVIFLTQVFHVHLTLDQVLTVMGILMVTSKGAAGVTGSGLTVLVSTITALKIIPVEGIALLLGVDRFMSEARAITNIIGNGAATVFLAANEKEFDRTKMETAFSEDHG